MWVLSQAGLKSKLNQRVEKRLDHSDARKTRSRFWATQSKRLNLMQCENGVNNGLLKDYKKHLQRHYTGLKKEEFTMQEEQDRKDLVVMLVITK